MTDTTTEEVVKTDPTEPGDHDKMAHYVAKISIIHSMVEGKPAIALCGKKWVPTRDGEKFPICPECQEIWNGLNDA